MKKITAFIIGLVLMCSFVLAEGEQEAGANGQGQPDDTPTPVLISAGQDREQEREQNRTGPVIMQGEIMVHAGLANALTTVENENARERIQRNMERFLERYQQRLQRMEDVEVEVDEETEETTIKAKEPVRFLGFIKGKATKRFEMDRAGNINERAPWYRFLYAESE